nr:hypothetical protein [Mycobacterium sp. JS623]
MASTIGPLARLAVRGQYVLNLLECGDLDERLMDAGVLDALPGDVTEVVPVAENLVELVRRERPHGSFCCWPLRQPAGVKRSSESRQRPVSGGVLVECPDDVGRTLSVDTDGSDFASIDRFANVEIADRRDRWCAAVQCLLFGAFHDFVREIPAVELGNARHDAVHEDAARRGVDVLGDADERATGRLYREVDLHVIGSVAREPVDLVDDHIGGRVFGKVGKHSLQFRAVCRLGGLTGVDEFSFDGRAELLCFAFTCLSLCGD